MIKLGKNTHSPEDEDLIQISLQMPLNNMPYLEKGWDLVCGYDNGLGEVLYVCKNIDEANGLYKKYTLGYAVTINWYKGHDCGFVIGI